MNQMEHQFRNNLTERALKSDSISANLLSQNVNWELQDRQDQLDELSSGTLLRKSLEDGDNSALFDYLKQEKQIVDDKRADLNREQDTSWFLTDDKGTQLWRDPPGPTIGQNFSYRDYFHGHGKEYKKGEAPQSIKPIREPYICQVFKSEATNQWMVAVAVPIWNLEHTQVIGVLARTTHLDQLLKQYEQSIRGDSGKIEDRKIALINNRDGKMLAHSQMTAENMRAMSQAEVDQLILDDNQFKQLQLFKLAQKKEPNSQSTAIMDNYHDPVEAILSNDNHQDNKWLAAFSPVGSTGWTAIVQERRSMALRPVAEMRSWLIQYGLIVLVTSCFLVLTVWYFVMRVLTERRAWDWARHHSEKQSDQGSTSSTWPKNH